MALGSMGTGVTGSVAVLASGPDAQRTAPGQLVLVALIWIIIGIVNVVYARRD